MRLPELFRGLQAARMGLDYFSPRIILPTKADDEEEEEGKMQLEIQVALNFIISYLYNKLPRRRVNLFAEEFQKAMREKFLGHWYPDKPFKGSAYRCVKIDPGDPILQQAAHESGVDIYDVLQFLPLETAIWIDPGEVSYRIGEKGPVKVLFTELQDLLDEYSADREVTKTFNPEAQCFQPIENYSAYYGPYPPYPMNPYSPYGYQSISPYYPSAMNGYCGSADSTPTQFPFRSSPSPIPTFLPRTTTPLTFTTATFAQTKFGSTKLKNSGKRTNRMSPTEFSNYIKQRAMQQQMQQQMHQQLPQQMHQPMHPQLQSSMMGRAVSPSFQNFQGPPLDNYYFPQAPTHFQPQYGQQNFYDNSQYMPEMYNNYTGWENYNPNQYLPQQQIQQNMSFNRNSYYVNGQQDGRQVLDSRNNFGPRRSQISKQ